MAKGNIQHDVLQLMDKYPVGGILDEIVSLGATEEVRKWAVKYFDIKPQTGDELDKDLMRGVLRDIEVLKSKIARFEFEKDPMQTTRTFPKEISDIFDNMVVTAGESGTDDLLKRIRMMKNTETNPGS